MTASKSLPARPSLESLRKQAKRFARNIAAGDAAAIARARAHLPNVDLSLTQRNAQLVIAREYGYTGWQDLTAEVSKRLGKELESAAAQSALLGKRSVRLGIALIILCTSISCDHSAPTQPTPTEVSLAGRWIGSLTNPVGSRPSSLGDWTVLMLNLESDGAGELVTNDGQHFPVVSRPGSAGTRLLDVVFTPSSLCTGVTLAITSVHLDGSGGATSFSGSISGRCPNTLINDFTFMKD